MNILLVSLPIAGLFWTLFLLLFSFGGVYVAELVKLGWAYKTQSPPPSTAQPEQQEKAPAEKTQEPIYYIVERKKRPPKSGFEDPKPFTFKSDRDN